jgi:membrane protein DedA with SNARE-associated domain
MQNDLPSLVNQYGYIAIFFGTILEGETVLILGGFAAKRGYLEWFAVVGVGTLGGFIGDQLYFGAGRLYGARLVRFIPSLVPKLKYVNQLVLRHPVLLIIGIRFLYGLRIPGPIAIGMTPISWWKFGLLNLLGALIWASAVTAIGYAFGRAAERILADLARFEFWIAGFLILLLVGVHFIRKYWR